MKDRQFDISDLERWAQKGLITRTQLRDILDEQGESMPDNAQPSEMERGFTVVTLLSYFGASIALTGFAIFAGVNWGDASPGARVILVASPLTALLTVGYYLRTQTAYRLGGNLLFLVGMALVPILFFAVGDALRAGDDTEFLSEDDLPGATALLAISVVITAAAVVATRIAPASLVPAGLAVATAAVAGAWRFGSDNEEDIWWSALAGGAAVLGVSVVLYALREREFGLWTGAAGHLGFYTAIAYLL